MEKSPEAFRTISEAAELLDTPAHVLRFWESRFPQVRPVKRAGGRRYYRPTDVALLSGIKRLLHSDGLTIRGVQKVLREQGIRHVMALADGAIGNDALNAPLVDADPATGSPDVQPLSVETVLVLGTPIAPNAGLAEPVLSLPLWSASEGLLTEDIQPSAQIPPLADAAPSDAAGTHDAPDRPEQASQDESIAASLAGGDTPEFSDFADAPADWLASRLRAFDPSQALDHRITLAALAGRLQALRDRLALAARGGDR